MDSFFGSANTSYSLNNDANNDSLANFSSAANRTKMFLNEIVSSHHQNQSSINSPSRLFKPSVFSNNNITNNTNAMNSFSQDSTFVQDKQEQKSGIYTQFKQDTDQNIDQQNDLINLLGAYSKTCSENVDFLKERLQHVNVNRQKDYYNSILNEQSELINEKNLWQLILILYSDEQKLKGVADDHDDDSSDNELMENDENMNIMDSELNFETVNEQTIVKNLEKNNHVLRRIRLVIKWLEKIASESNYMKSIRENLSSFAEKSTNWEHTLHNLKNYNNFVKRDKLHAHTTREFVTELDPDAPMRQNKSLHDLDQEDEYKIMEYIFAFIRAGDVNGAKDFCSKVGQLWRAATLEGCKLFQDDNYFNNLNSFGTLTNKNQRELSKNEGNLNRDIWRLMVYKLIKNEQSSPFEKAVYASLAGFVGPVLPVCKTYLDFVWAYFKALYNKIIEKEIRQKITVRDYVNMPYDADEDHLFYNATKSADHANLPTINQIFDKIRLFINNGSTGLINDSIGSGMISSLNPMISAQIINNLKTETQKPHAIILKHIICSGIDGFRSGTNELIDFLSTAIIEETHNGGLLRLSTHLALFYKAASLKIHENSFIQILDSFSQYLIQHEYKEIIAYYLSKLPSEMQIKRYSKFLQTIKDNKERQVLLKLAKDRNMNVQAITLNIVDNLSKHTAVKKETTDSASLSASGFLPKSSFDFITSKPSQTLTSEDETKINAIDWILYDPMQRFKLLEYANLTMRYFLLERQNFTATQRVFSKIPTDTVAIILAQYNYTQHNSTQLMETNFNITTENLPPKVSNALKEYLCFKAYIESINSYNEWFDFFYKEKPQKPANYMDTQAESNVSMHSHEKTFAEKMTLDFKLKQYDDLLNRWNSKAHMFGESVKKKFLAVLKFPNGWMVDVKNIDANQLIDDEDGDDDDDDENSSESETIDQDEDLAEQDDSDDEMNSDMDSVSQNQERRRSRKTSKRSRQLKQLRKLYLPNVCFVMLDMLAKMNSNQELIKLADLVACENYKLYKLFDKSQMKCLLNKIADSSICLLDSSKDYLGYN